MDKNAPVLLADASGLVAILVFLLGAVAFLLLPIMLGRFMRPDRPNAEKNAPYESGEAPEGFAHGRFNLRFYMVALLFLLFDVELVLLYPWATVYADAGLIAANGKLWGWLGLIEIVVFVALLGFGLAYAWANGYLVWVKPKTAVADVERPLPTSVYQAVNARVSTISKVKK